MTNKLKRNESYYQSVTSSLFRTREGKPPQKDLEDQNKSQEILIPASEISLKRTPQNFYEGKIAEDIQERHSVASDIVILQMVRGDIIEFERKWYSHKT